MNRRGADNILVVDRLKDPKSSDEKYPNLTPLKFSEVLDADEFLARMVKGQFESDVQAILHMGAISSTTESDADLLKRNNTDYTRTLAQVAIQKGVRFIYASSAATYGNGCHGYSDDPGGIDRLRPLNLYGESKHRFDLWARDSGALERIAGLKYFNVFGPNEYHKADMRSVVLKSYEQIRNSGQVRLFKSYRQDYADGEQVRDFLYVKDAVDMTLFFLDHPAANGLFNVGSGVTHTWKELVTPVFSALQTPVRIEFVDMPRELRDKYQYHTLADISRVGAAGYTRPLMPLAVAVQEYVRDYLIPHAHLKP